MAGISSKSANGLDNKFEFGGKEKQEKEFSDGLGLEMYNFGVRNYDPQIARWFQIDPFFNIREWLTGYNYVQNNPIIRVDPTGAVDWKKNQEGDYEYDADLTEENASERLGEGEKYLGKSYKLNIVSNDEKQTVLNTFSLNENGSVSDAKGNHWNDNFGTISLGTAGGEEIINKLTLSDIWNGHLMRSLIPDQISFGFAFNSNFFLGGGAEPIRFTLLTRGKEPGIYLSSSPNGNIGSGVEFNAGLTISRGFYTGNPREIRASFLEGHSHGVSVGLGAVADGSIGISYAPLNPSRPLQGGFVNVNAQLGLGVQGSPATGVNIQYNYQYTHTAYPLIRF